MQLKAFTIAEMLIALVLISLSITLSYHALTYVQKLFQAYEQQNEFIAQYTRFKNTLDHEFRNCDKITEETENEFVFHSDSLNTRLSVSTDYLLLSNGNQRDSLKSKVNELVKTYENSNEQRLQEKLLKGLSFEINYTRQKFNFCFYKSYDASVKLALINPE